MKRLIYLNLWLYSSLCNIFIYCYLPEEESDFQLLHIFFLPGLFNL